MALGGLICGGYAAIKYLGAQTPEERVRYDWMGYVGNFCAVCHGPDGKPKLKEARDFRDAQKMNKFTDSYWFRRISERVPGTKMPPWKGAFTQKQRWQGMAYKHQFSHDGKAEEHAHPEMNSADKKAE